MSCTWVNNAVVEAIPYVWHSNTAQGKLHTCLKDLSKFGRPVPNQLYGSSQLQQGAYFTNVHIILHLENTPTKQLGKATAMAQPIEIVSAVAQLISVAKSIYDAWKTSVQNKDDLNNLVDELVHIEQLFREFGDTESRTQRTLLNETEKRLKTLLHTVLDIQTEVRKQSRKWAKRLFFANDIAVKLSRAVQDARDLRQEIKRHAYFADLFSNMRREFQQFGHRWFRGRERFSRINDSIELLTDKEDFQSDLHRHGDLTQPQLTLDEEISKEDKVASLPQEIRLLLQELVSPDSDENARNLAHHLQVLLNVWKVSASNVLERTRTEVIYQGSAGFVFKGLFQDENKRQVPVVIKQFDPGFRSTAIREAFLHLALREHPCILHLYGVVVDRFDKVGNRPELVMEDMTHTLDAAVRRELIRPGDLMIRRILVDVCSALQFLHSRLISHRDLKPSSIFLRLERRDGSPRHKLIGCAKLCGFGTARQLKRHQNLSMSMSREISPSPVQSSSFLPPEVLVNSGSCRSSRSWDIWAFGLLIGFMFTKDLPRSWLAMASDPSIGRDAILSNEINRWTARISDLALRKIASSCLNLDPSNRPSIDEVYHSLNNEELDYEQIAQSPREYLSSRYDLVDRIREACILALRLDQDSMPTNKPTATQALKIMTEGYTARDDRVVLYELYRAHLAPDSMLRPQDQDHEIALVYLNKAMRLNEPLAIFSHAVSLRRDLDQARLLMEQASNLGFSWATYNVALKIGPGFNGESRFQSRHCDMEKLRHAANRGLVEAMLAYARRVESENGELAQRYYKLAADNGSAIAKFKHAKYLRRRHDSNGREQSKAIEKLYREANEEGILEAGFDLALMHGSADYYRSTMVSVIQTQVSSPQLKAKACYNLALKQRRNACQLYKDAFRHDEKFGLAAYNAGILSLRQNPSDGEGKYYLQRAAELKVPSANFVLATMYRDGTGGCEKNVEQMLAHFILVVKACYKMKEDDAHSKTYLEIQSQSLVYKWVADAVLAVGLCFEHNFGVPHSPPTTNSQRFIAAENENRRGFSNFVPTHSLHAELAFRAYKEHENGSLGGKWLSVSQALGHPVARRQQVQQHGQY